MVGPELMVEWRRRLDDFAAKGLHNRVVVRENAAEYVGMTNLPAEEDDRAVVRVSAVCDDWVVDANGATMHHTGNATSETWVREYWTLVMRDGHWTLSSIEQDAEGEHQLTAPLVAERGRRRRRHARRDGGGAGGRRPRAERRRGVADAARLP